jgi:hypothetical protein
MKSRPDPWKVSLAWMRAQSGARFRVAKAASGREGTDRFRVRNSNKETFVHGDRQRKPSTQLGTCAGGAERSFAVRQAMLLTLGRMP